MTPDPSPDVPPASSDWLEELVASALEALDRSGEEALQRFLDRHAEHRTQIEYLVRRFRDTGLLARDSRTEIPERLGEFRLLKRLGGGGMGVVFLAEQESLRRTVALKIVRPDLLFFVGTRERFQREIDVIARLAHPAIVPIVATGEHDGMPWYAMQLIHGCSVEEAVRRLRGRDPSQLRGLDLWRVVHGSDEAASQLDRSQFAGEYWEACVRLIRQTALGLEHAHRQGVVHRDVKPSNIMLTPDGRAQLLDFGLARVHGDPKLTRTGGEPGSPAYMAPEQLRGQTADERADVYSLAATLFQLVDLQAPFAADNAEGLRTAILRGGATLQNHALPRELRLALAVAMDVDRDRRYETAAAFAEELEAVLARRPIQARPLPLHVRSRRWLQRHRTAAALLLACGVLAIVMPIVLAWQQANSLAELAIEKGRAERSRDAALGAVQVFLTRFASSDLTMIPGGREVGAELLDRATEQIDGIAKDVAPEQLRPHLTYLGRWQVSGLRLVGRPDQALAKAREVLALWPDPAKVPPRLGYILASTRSELLKLAVTGSAVPDIDQQIAAAGRELDLAAADATLADDVAEMRATIELEQATLLSNRGDAEGSVLAMQRTVAWVEASGKSACADNSTMGVLRNRLGEALLRLGRFAEAKQNFETVLAAFAPTDDPAIGSNEGLYLRVYATWGLAHLAAQQEHWAECQQLYRQTLQLAEHRLFCYSGDSEVRLAFAKILTEVAQVDRQCGGDDTAVTATLERARRLFLMRRDLLASDLRASDGCCIALHVLSEQYWKAQDGASLASVARDMADVGKHDARRLSLAAWRLVQAAIFLAGSGDADAAAKCDDDALAALLACDQQGWFPPTRLDAPPFQRLASRPEFAVLVQRHPQ